MTKCNEFLIGLNYAAQFPWEAKEEFPLLFDSICQNYKSVEIIANSIGAFFAMNSLSEKKIERAYFISPIVNMERLIGDMMQWANVTEEELQTKKEIETSFGETLSWEYLSYVRKNPVTWAISTYILYGEKDHLSSYETISEFAKQNNATLTVMRNGEHWFHTKGEMQFLDDWIRQVAQQKDEK